VRALLQRVLEASVTVEGTVTGAIGPGLLVFLGVGKEDGDAEALALADKVASLRIFEDDQGKMNRSLLETSKALLSVSQFTLLADTRKGRRPSFVDAMEPTGARRQWELFNQRCRELGLGVEVGVFGGDMKVALVNDGPVTIWLDTRA
jgi:D-tyrosyl-tRNA(Tyr) deacylase